MVQMTSYEPRERASRTVCVSPDKARMKGQAIKWTAGPEMGRARQGRLRARDTLGHKSLCAHNLRAGHSTH